VFYMACLGAATQHNPVPEGLFTIAWLPRGKKKKVALIACMRKLISILNIMIERRQKMGCQPVRSELIERQLGARSPTERLQSQTDR